MSRPWEMQLRSIFPDCKYVAGMPQFFSSSSHSVALAAKRETQAELLLKSESKSEERTDWLCVGAARGRDGWREWCPCKGARGLLDGGEIKRASIVPHALQARVGARGHACGSGGYVLKGVQRGKWRGGVARGVVFGARAHVVTGGIRRSREDSFWGR